MAPLLIGYSPDATRSARRAATASRSAAYVIPNHWSGEVSTSTVADPAKKVDKILLDSSSVTFWYDSGSIFPECSRVRWTRQFDGTSASQMCLPAAVGAVPEVNMAALTPDRLASALSLLSASQPSAASRGAIVFSSGDTIFASMTQGSSEKHIEIYP